MPCFFRAFVLAHGVCVSFVATVSAQQGVRIDCYLPADTVACAQVETTLGEERGDEALVLRARPLAQCVDFVVTRGRKELHDCVDRSVPSDVALGRVVALARRAMLSDQSTSQAHATGGTGWYLEPNASVYYFAASGFALSTLSGQLTLNHSTPVFRVRIQGKIRHRHYSLPDGADRLVATFLDGGAGAVAMRTIAPHFGLGLASDALALPYQNESLVLSGGPGFEWTLHDFLAVNDTNVALRYELRAQHYLLASDNFAGMRDFWALRHLLTAALHYHGDRVDLELSAVAGVHAAMPRFWDVTLASSVAFRIVEGLRIAISFNAVLRGDVQHATPDARTLPVGYGLVGGGDFGATTVETSLSLSYVVGDAELQASDQRWR